MAGRRSHTKSRLGCQECKRRKIKCDEQRPSCFNCTRHGTPCSFLPKEDTKTVPDPDASHICCLHGRPCTSQASSDHLDRAATSEITSTLLSPSVNNLEPSFHNQDKQLSHGDVNCPTSPDLLVSSATDNSTINQISVSWTRDLELIHHFCTVTSATFAHHESARHVWRFVIPQQGYMHEFVMHGILSLSALHKAYQLRSKRETYLTLSAYHYAIGQKDFRALLPNVTAETWKPVYCFASIVIAYVFCQPAACRGESMTSPILNTLELFSVTRGIKAVLMPFIGRITETDLAPLVHTVWSIPVHEKLNNYKNLSTEWKPSLEFSPLPNDLFQELSRLRLYFKEEVIQNREDYDKAISALEVLAMNIVHLGVNIEVGAVMIWPFLLPESVETDIRHLKPHALVVLSYYSVFLAVLDGSFWFLKGRAKDLLDDIDHHLYGNQLRELLSWPKAHVP